MMTPALNRLTIDNAHLVSANTFIAWMWLTCRTSLSRILTGKIVFLIFYTSVTTKNRDLGVFASKLKRAKILATRSTWRHWSRCWCWWLCRWCYRRSTLRFTRRTAWNVANLPSHCRISCVAPGPVFVIVQIATVVVVCVIGSHVRFVRRVTVPRLTSVARERTGNIAQIRASVIALLKLSCHSAHMNFNLPCGRHLWWQTHSSTLQ